MSEDQTEDQAAEEGQADPPAETESPNQEAAKYRVRLRETETRLEAAEAQLRQARKLEVERVAQLAGLAKPTALWAAGTQLDDLLTDGQVDTEAVTAAAQSTAEELGINTGPRLPAPDPSQGARPGTAPSATEQFSAAFTS